MSEEKKEPREVAENVAAVLAAVGWVLVFLFLVGVVVTVVAAGVTLVYLGVTALSGWFAFAAVVGGAWLTGSIVTSALKSLYQMGKKAGEKSVRRRLFR